jgi:tRNA(Ile)-lysidine synthase
VGKARHDARSTIDREVSSLSLPHGAKVLVAVSGGPDSVALLRSLLRVAPTRQWSLRVGHVNHGLREHQSEIDATFVRELANRLGLDVVERSPAVAQHAADQRLSEETAARELRYKALHTMLDEWHGDAIAVAHTLNDQAETLLLHLLRGSGLTGLGGMSVYSGRIVRPLLQVDRQTVITALQEDGQGYRLDSSNHDLRHTRTRLRNTVLPALKTVQPHPAETLARAARLLHDEGQLLARETREALTTLNVETTENGIRIDRAVLAALHPALRKSLIREIVRSVRGDLFDVTDLQIDWLSRWAENAAPQHTPMPSPSRLVVMQHNNSISIAAKPPATALLPDDAALPVPGQTDLSIGHLTVDVSDAADPEVMQRLLTVCGPYHAICDAEALGRTLVAGPPRRGDALRPIGLDGTKSIKDLLSDARIPRESRHQIIVLRNPEHVVWVVGIATDERVAVRPLTQRVAHIRYTH